MSADARIKFSKIGRLQFISHLDLVRTMKTALFRAGIPMKYSEGFNPHPKIAFVMQLSVGAQSVCEYMDIGLSEDIPFDVITDRLRANLTPELYVQDTFAPVHKAHDVGFAEYDITYDCPAEEAPVFASLITDPLLVMKKTKSGDPKETDIRPMILRWSQEGSKLNIVLSAGDAKYLNPEYIAKLPLSLPGGESKYCDYSIMRKKVYLADGFTEFC